MGCFNYLQTFRWIKNSFLIVYMETSLLVLLPNSVSELIWPWYCYGCVIKLTWHFYFLAMVPGSDVRWGTLSSVSWKGIMQGLISWAFIFKEYPRFYFIRHFWRPLRWPHCWITHVANPEAQGLQKSWLCSIFGYIFCFCKRESLLGTLWSFKNTLRTFGT